MIPRARENRAALPRKPDSQPALYVVSREDSAPASGPPMSVTELARRVGMSATFIRTEIRAGQLQAVAFGRGKRRVFRISAAEARRYANSLGLVL